MQSVQIRQKFLDFYKSKEHELVTSAPMVIKDDPTLMFTNAGMNQFKDIFLGNKPAKYPRVANSQKCLRVSGKHNDLEEVGVDTYHHTMFEMLGNWSFGDYFKKEAIEWAWELLTVVYGIDPEKLYVSIFSGDENDGLPEDSETREIWENIIPKERILAFDKKDNFWEMGETGPCGPCSEIHIDLRSDKEKSKIPGNELVNKDHPQVIEIWNLVFMQQSRMADGSLVDLPAKHIDTGMGFERLAVVLQGVQSNYDTDVFQPLIKAIEKESGIKYQSSNSKQDIAIRVVSDHVRAVAFSIADGQLPSNSGAGYVIRRILRRGIRYAYSFLELKKPFIHTLVSILSKQMGDYFPELKDQETLITKVIEEEEENFLRTLAKGIQRLNELIDNTEGAKLEGAQVFELYDTFGFPADLTALIASEHDKSIDEQGFDVELKKQKERSRAAGKVETEDWVVLLEDEVEEFVGYDFLEADVKITRYRAVTQKGDRLYQLVFNLTPFYPEGGGQVGDTGIIKHGDQEYEILDTKKENNLIIHTISELPENPKALFKASVDEEKRRLAASNHTATHLMHHALRSVLGPHVEQKGSLVAPGYLRFDFSHFAKVKPEELESIEIMVNSMIRQNLELEEQRQMPLSEAKAQGAMMLFGEKYGDAVRLIRFGDSSELCGGIHVPSTSEIGSFRILSETAVAAGIRRIEAITNDAADKASREERDLIKRLKTTLKNVDVEKAVSDLISNSQELQKSLDESKKEQAQGARKDLQNEIEDRGGVRFLAKRIDLDAKSIKDIAFQLKSSEPKLFAVFGSANNGKASITVVVGDEAIAEKNLHAGEVVKVLSKFIRGGGGGQAFFATAGGSDPNGIDEAISQAASFISD